MSERNVYIEFSIKCHSTGNTILVGVFEDIAETLDIMRCMINNPILNDDLSYILEIVVKK